MFNSIQSVFAVLLSLPMSIVAFLGRIYVLHLFKDRAEARCRLSRRRIKATVSLMGGGFIAFCYLMGMLILALSRQLPLSLSRTLIGMLVTAGLSAVAAYLGIVVADHMYGSQ